MPVQNKPIIHARDHEPGGADPIRFPTSIPGNFEEMARAWSDAYWKLEEVNPGSAFLDELPGHHDLYPTTESGLTRGLAHGPEEPASVGIDLGGGTFDGGTGTPGPQLATLPTDEGIGVSEDSRVGFFSVITPDAETAHLTSANYCIAACYDPAGVTTAFDELRWALLLAPNSVPTTPVSWGFHLVGIVNGPGGTTTLHGTTLLVHPLGQTLVGETFDVGFNYTGTQIELYVNGGLEASHSAVDAWDGITTQTGTFVLGQINGNAGVSGGHWNYHGAIGSAMLSTDAAFTSGQIKNLHDGEPTVGGFPGEITAEQHGTIPTGDLHPEYVQEAEVAAKGDLLAGTGAGTVDNLPVGTNGQTLVADSTAATGVKWATPTGGNPALDTAVWLPLTTVTGGVPELVWDANDSLIPTLDPI